MNLVPTFIALLTATLFLTGPGPAEVIRRAGTDGSALALTSLAISADDCRGEQLTLLYSEFGGLHSYAMIQGPGDNLLVAGSTGPECFFTEVSGPGDVLWSKSVDVLAGREETITRIKLDADGHLICIGRNTEAIADWFIMRIDLQSLQVMWMTRFDDVGEFIVRDLTDPGAGRPLVISGSERNSPAPGFSTDMFVRGVDRASGEIVAQPFNNFNIGSAEDGSAILSDGDGYYVVGRYTRTGGFNDIRMGISRLDADGKAVWSRMLHVPLNASARLYGRNLALKNGDIYFIGSGDPDGTSNTSTLSYLGRMTPDGDLVFLKEIDISGFMGQSLTSLTPADNGFIISCFQKEAGRARGLIRVNDNGDLLNAVNYGEGLNADPYSEFEVVVVNDLTATVIKTTVDHSPNPAVELLEFNIEDPNVSGDGCAELQALEVTITEVLNPANVDIDPTEYNTNTTTAGAPLPLMDLAIRDSVVCGCFEICDNGIDDDMDGLIDCADPDLFDSCCCIEILPLDLGPDLTIGDGDTAFISVNEGYEGSIWSTGETGPQIAVTDEGWYWAQATICDTTVIDSVLVTVFTRADSCASDVYVPNIFSPNGDGVNDALSISFSSENIAEIIFIIYNRWGGVEFETRDPYFSWDGQINGKTASPGVYVYMLEVACGGQPQTISGDITIVH